MRKIGKNAMSRHLQNGVSRLSLVAVALSLVASSGVRSAVAQTPEEIAKQLSNEGVDDALLNEWLETMPNAEDIKLAEAELEIYKILSGATEYDQGEDVVFLVGARNLGKQPAVFDYAISLIGSNTAPWFIQSGVRLSGGEQHFTGFVIRGIDLANAYQKAYPKKTTTGGIRQVCFAFTLLQRGSKVLFRDRDLPNHQKEDCVEVNMIVN